MRMAKVFLHLAFVGGLGLLAFASWHLNQIRACERWPAVDAVVATCTVFPEPAPMGRNRGGKHDRERVDFAYSYEVDGTRYTSGGYYFLPGRPPSWILVRDFPVGLHFAARFCPTQPQFAIIEPGPPNYVAFGFAGMFIAFATAGYVYNHFQR